MSREVKAKKTWDIYQRFLPTAFSSFKVDIYRNILFYFPLARHPLLWLPKQSEISLWIINYIHTSLPLSRRICKSPTKPYFHLFFSFKLIWTSKEIFFRILNMFILHESFLQDWTWTDTAWMVTVPHCFSCKHKNIATLNHKKTGWMQFLHKAVVKSVGGWCINHLRKHYVQWYVTAPLEFFKPFFTPL